MSLCAELEGREGTLEDAGCQGIARLGSRSRQITDGWMDSEAQMTTKVRSSKATDSLFNMV